MSKIKVGMAVQWKENPEYTGIAWHVEGGTVTVEFLFPTCFTMQLSVNDIEPVQKKKKNDIVDSINYSIEVMAEEENKKFEQQILDRTLLNTEEREDLKNMFIELALQTRDFEWLSEIMKGKLM